MNIGEKVCKIHDTITAPSTIFHLVTIGFLCILAGLFIIIWKKQKKIISKILLSVGTVLGLFFLWAIVSIGIWIALIREDIPPSLFYHPLNAMIKLRCYKDHMYCPHTENEVSMIAPVEVKEQLHNAKTTYSYYQNTNQYTLIIRNNYPHANNDRVVIFDPRIAYAKNYGFNGSEQGIDFYDADIINNCDGTFSLINPPPFPGPWKNIK